MELEMEAGFVCQPATASNQRSSPGALWARVTARAYCLAQVELFVGNPIVG